MKNVPLIMIAALLIMPAAAQAQDGDENRLQGPHIGIEAMRDSNKASQPASTREASRKGYGGRAHIGYDAVLGNVILAGVEIGAGIGGRTIDQASLVTPGRYKVDPGLSYDATARLGISPVNGLALYGRAGYRWLKTEQSVTGQTTGNFTRKETEKGLTYGGGIEFAATENISFRAEYNRTKFNDDLRQSKISLGASFRF
jgi:outer membrane immunogenic protein